MKISEKWLHEWVDASITSEKLAEQLTMAGLEVEGIETVAPLFQSVIVGEIVDISPHSNADHLWVCQVNIGKSSLQIVTAAENATLSARVAVATVGAQLPRVSRVEEVDFKGMISSGLLCSLQDLGLTDSISSGLYILPHDAPIGQDLREYLDLNDIIFEIKLTPNRADCLSVMGLAREVASTNKTKLKSPSFKSIAAQIPTKFPIQVSAPKDCPRYIGRVITGINSKAISPIWLQERLRRSGIRSIHPVVDVANYVMMELGQPLHAFDLDKLEKKIDVRLAKSAEKITLLDGREVELNPDTLIIADDTKPLAIAGIMGELDSAVSESTTNIFLESAFFAPLSIVGRARRYGLATDASQRFERGVDPNLAAKAAERATEILLQIVGGEVGPLIEVVSQDDLPKTAIIQLRLPRVKALLGIELSPAVIKELLVYLGMQIAEKDSYWEVTVPSYRFDLQTEVDLIEEIARSYGYDHIPSKLPAFTPAAKSIPENSLSAFRIREWLMDKGFQEIISYSFIDSKLQQKLDPENKPIELENPISAEMNVMRTQLWPGLINALNYNLNRQQSRAKFFEIGMCFVNNSQGVEQEMRVGGVLSGSIFPEQWGVKNRAVDFFDLKGEVECLLTNSSEVVQYTAAIHPALHPGQSAAIMMGDTQVGLLGALHPALQKDLDLPQQAFLFEISLSAMGQQALPSYKELSKFPSIRRDIAFVIKDNIPLMEISKIIKQAAGNLLKNLQLFDVYQGNTIQEGQRSLAFGLILQASDRTLVDEEVNQLIGKVVGTLQDNFSVIMRD